MSQLVLSWPQSGMVVVGEWGIVAPYFSLEVLRCLISTAQDLNGVFLVCFCYHYQRQKHREQTVNLEYKILKLINYS